MHGRQPIVTGMLTALAPGAALRGPSRDRSGRRG